MISCLTPEYKSLTEQYVKQSTYLLLYLRITEEIRCNGTYSDNLENFVVLSCHETKYNKTVEANYSE